MPLYDVSYRLPGGTKEVVRVHGKHAQDAGFEGLFMTDLATRLWVAGKGPWFAKTENLETGEVEGIELKISRGKVQPDDFHEPPEVESDLPSGEVTPADDSPIPGVSVDFTPEAEERLRAMERCDECGKPEDDLTVFEGVRLCQSCHAIFADVPEDDDEEGEDDDDGVPVIQEIPEGSLRYQVTYGIDLVPGHPDRFACQMDAESPVKALSMGELVCLRRKGADFVAAWNARGVPPTLTVVGRRSSPKPPPGHVVTPSPQVDPASVQYDYSVTIYLGNREVAGTKRAPTPQLACAMFLSDQIKTVGEELAGNHSDVPMKAVRIGKEEDCWGIGPVRIPLEKVMKYNQMNPEMQRRVRKAMGIEQWDAPPPLALGGIESFDKEPDEATRVG